MKIDRGLSRRAVLRRIVGLVGALRAAPALLLSPPGRATAAALQPGGPSGPLPDGPGTAPGEQPSREFLFRDDFDGPGLAPGWLRTDTAGTGITLKGGRAYLVSTAQRWNDPSLWTAAAYPRSSVGAVVALVRTTGFWGTGLFVGVSSGQPPANPATEGRGIYFGIFQFYAAGSGVMLSRADTHLRSIDYLLITVPRPDGGCWLIISGGDQFGTFPQGTLVWLSEAENEPELRAGLSNRDAWGWVDFLHVLDAGSLPPHFTAQYGLAVAADTFRRDAEALGTTEVGQLAWRTVSGSPRLTGQAVVRGTDEMVWSEVNAPAAPRFIEIAVTTPASGPASVAVLCRSDSTRANYVEFRATSRDIEIRSCTDGTVVEVFQSPVFRLQPGRLTRLMILDDGEAGIRCFLDEREVTPGLLRVRVRPQLAGCGWKIDEASAPGVGIQRFALWPGRLDLPEQFGPMLALPPVPPVVHLEHDRFDAPDGTPLSTYDARWRPEFNTDWRIVGGCVQQAAPGVEGYVTFDTGSITHEISADVTMPDTTPPWPRDWFCGIGVRWTDLYNNLTARFLWFENSPEIEIREHVGTTGAVINFVKLGTWSLRPNQTYHLRLAVQSQEISVWWNGELVHQTVTALTHGTRVFLSAESPTSGVPRWTNISIRSAV